MLYMEPTTFTTWFGKTGPGSGGVVNNNVIIGQGASAPSGGDEYVEFLSRNLSDKRPELWRHALCSIVGRAIKLGFFCWFSHTTCPNTYLLFGQQCGNGLDHNCIYCRMHHHVYQIDIDGKRDFDGRDGAANRIDGELAYLRERNRRFHLLLGLLRDQLSRVGI